MKKQCCILCGKPLYDGIILKGRGICRACEKRLVNLETNTDFYEHYKNIIKRTLIQPMIKGEEIRCQTYHL